MNFTDKQTAVGRLLATGDCDKEIAAKLGLSLSGVRTHVRAIMVKTGKRNRAGAAVAFDRSSVRNDASVSPPTTKLRKAVH